MGELTVCNRKKTALSNNATGKCGQLLKMGVANDNDVDEVAKKLLVKHRRAF